MSKSSANYWPPVPYLVRISVAEKDGKHKCHEDPRYNGWREIWAKCGIELFDRVLDKKLRDAYLTETLNYADSLPAVCMLKKRLNISASDSERLSSSYRYYCKKNGVVSHRISVELVLQPSI